MQGLRGWSFDSLSPGELREPGGSLPALFSVALATGRKGGALRTVPSPPAPSAGPGPRQPPH